MAKFIEKYGFIWQWFYSSWVFFCATHILCDSDIVDFSDDCVHNFQMFYRTKKIINYVHLQRCAMFWSEFLYPWVFFCKILSFLAMVDFVFFSGEQCVGLREKPGKICRWRQPVPTRVTMFNITAIEEIFGKMWQKVFEEEDV